MASLNHDQQNALISLIDHWYLYAKHQIVDGNQTHRLGALKEELKRLVCGYDLATDTCNKWKKELKEMEDEA